MLTCGAEAERVGIWNVSIQGSAREAAPQTGLALFGLRRFWLKREHFPRLTNLTLWSSGFWIEICEKMERIEDAPQ